MKRISILLAALAFTFISCQKSINYNGTVYSRHHVPMPGVLVTLTYGTNAQTEGTYMASTDASGHFELKIRIPKKRSIQTINITARDSGRFSTSANQQASWTNDDIVLQ